MLKELVERDTGYTQPDIGTGRCLPKAGISAPVVASGGARTTCMSGSRSLVDTNVLVYAYDAATGTKREWARALLPELWETGEG